MMHPYFVASLIVGGAVVCYTAYILYKEFTEVPQFVFNDGPNTDRDTKWRSGQTNGYQSSDDESLSIVGSEEKSGIRRRRRSKGKSRRNLSNKSHSDDEQELLDRLSYLNAVEQEIERKKLQLANEERILSEREREVEKRRQNLSHSTRSSRSSSHSDLWQSINSPIGVTHSNHSTISTSTVDDDQPLIIGNPDVNSLNSAPPTVKTTSSSEQPQQQLMRSDVLPNQSPSLLKSVPTEETWSEIGSVISENFGSIMSSVVDIDMENIEH
ncbi:23098_t:CDS:2 [Cetraspora pellucida]|uniref:23098_t:CDS:1 n=1 Tax=Cetraspora pellucida TaxID=1433469 RepID=A0A9N9GR42_9GLOM|nr:23098_t:CDS:2 [Cetraspora pellucida]